MLRDLRPFLGHLAGRKRALAALFSLGMLASAAALANPLVGKAFVDAVVARGDYRAVPLVALALALLALADLLLGTCSRWIHARLSAEILADLRGRLFASCLRAPLDGIEAIRHGDLLTRFGSDLSRIQILLVDGLLGAAGNAIFLAVAAGILLHLSPPLAAWSFVGVALALAAAAAFRGPVQARAAAVRSAIADVSHFLSERLGALRAIRLHGAEAEERRGLAAESRRWARAVVRYQLLDSAVAGAPGLLLAAALAWIYLLGGRLLESGEITLGTFVAFVLYQGRLFSPAQGVLALLRNLQEARVSVRRVAEVLGASASGGGEEGRAAPGERAADVVAEGVTFGYPGRGAVLRGLDFRAEPGERIAILGASGEGKSSLVQLIFGLRAPGSGAVRVAGVPAQALREGGGGGVLGYAGAEPFLLHDTVAENVRYGNPRASAGEVARALRLAEAEAFVEALPAGAQTVIGGRGLALSDGQRQRIGLARLFLGGARVLVLDEAFNSLDPATEARVLENLWEAFPDRTVIAVAHRPAGLEAFDRVLVLREGRLEAAQRSDLGRSRRARPEAAPGAEGVGS